MYGYVYLDAEETDQKPSNGTIKRFLAPYLRQSAHTLISFGENAYHAPINKAVTVQHYSPDLGSPRTQRDRPLLFRIY